MADNNQGLRQASVRVITGTTYDYNGDWSALFDLEGIAAGDWNGRLLQWINIQMSAAYTDLTQAMQAYAASQGVFNWSSLGSFIDVFTYVRVTEDGGVRVTQADAVRVTEAAP